MLLKLLQKEQFKKQQNQLDIWLVTKLLIKNSKNQKIYNKIIQKQLQMTMMKKYLEKERQEIIDELKLNNIIMKYQKIIKVSKNSGTNQNYKEIYIYISKRKTNNYW